MGTDPDTNTYQLTLDQLCQQAGVTVRTVRYYISEGLLPPPHAQGPAARYGDIHLQRLLAIAQLKEQYLPLREIRRVLDGLDEAGIAALVAARIPDRQSVAEGVPMYSPPAPSPAAAYIEDLLGQAASTPRLVSRARMAAPEPADKAWRRLPITDDAELLIEADLYERRQEQIDSLISWAKRLLSGS
jgi:DNA-binding transcriptional MerR regulator